MEETLNQVKDFFEQNPYYVYLILGIVSLVLGIGHFMNKSWAIDPPNSTHKFNYAIFGHNAYRIVVGILFIIGALGFLFAFYSQVFN